MYSYTISNLSNKNTTTTTAKGYSAEGALRSYISTCDLLRIGETVFVCNNERNHDFVLAMVKREEPRPPAGLTFEEVTI